MSEEKPDTPQQPQKAPAADSLEQLIANLSSKEFRIKNEAIKSLGKLRHQKAREKLYEIAESPEWNSRLRTTAIEMLGRGNVDKRFIKIMDTLANDTTHDKEIRRAAITQLARLRDSSVLPTFVKALDDEYRFIRMWAVRGLIKIRDGKAITGLIKALGDSDEEIRKEAQEHIELQGLDAMPHLIKAFKDSASNKFIRFAVIGMLGRMEHPDAVPPLIDALNDGNPRVITLAVMGLGKCRHRDAILPIIEALKKNKDKRRIIEDALFHIGQENIRSMVAPLVDLLADTDAELHDFAVSLLGKLGTPAIAELSDIEHASGIDGKKKDAIKAFMDQLK